MTDSKITVRVSDDLLQKLDSIEGSRSEVTREALRNYVNSRGSTGQHGSGGIEGAFRDVIQDIVDDAVRERIDDTNVNLTVNMPEGSVSKPVEQSSAQVEMTEENVCPQCGEDVNEDHVHCPNCGAKTSNRIFCECGDEVRSDWSFCPSCGRRTPAGHALNP